MSNKSNIPGPEIAELLRRVGRGEAVLRCVTKGGWDFSGDKEFTVEKYTLVIFNDCGGLDYVSTANCSDGRSGDYNTWMDDEQEPVRLLTEQEKSAVQRALEATTT